MSVVSPQVYDTTTENAFIEGFNGKMQNRRLNEYGFKNIKEA
ncbi:transposase [Leptospira santarosai]|nr:transposase [Leptospira santarosai]